jgi:hypothetical protein
MASIKTRIQPINRDVQLMISQELSPAAQSKHFAELAGEQIEAARNINKQALGRVPPETITVDGRKGAPLESVKPNGVIIAEWDVFVEVLVWIADQLNKHSPMRSGRFRKNNTLFADGVETDVGQKLSQDVHEFVFINTLPYARKIESGSSSQAPDGVYQVVAVLARQRFGNAAKISFGYRTAIAGAFVGGRQGNRSSQRNPAIIVNLRGS